MQQLLQELVDEMRRFDPDTVKSLRPGLPSDALKQRFTTLPYEVSPDAMSLYAMADCADYSFKMPFEMLPGAYFIPFDKAVAEFEEIHGMRDRLEQISSQRYRDCFRFLTDKSDGGYAFGRIDSPSRGQIVSLEIHAPWRLAFRDLEHLLRTSIECYRQGIMRTNSGAPDFDAYFELAARMNPGMEAWTAHET
jgi:hypothetical protein